MVSLFFFIDLAGTAHAGCIGFQAAESWEFVDSHSIAIYDFSKPLGTLRIPWCAVFRLSDVCLHHSYLCEGDRIVVDDQACEIREIDLPSSKMDNLSNLQGGMLPLSFRGPPEFSEDEFERKKSTAKALCKEIAKDDLGIAFMTPDNSVERLNEILKTSNLYDLMVTRKKTLLLNEYARKLVVKTESYRNKKFPDLVMDEQRNILKLNRALLEEIYPQTCPKRLFSKMFCPGD